MYVVAKACRYRNKQLRPGDQFDGTRHDVRLYTALGWVTEKTNPPVAIPEPVVRVHPVLTDEVKPKRTYRRRDLVAE